MQHTSPGEHCLSLVQRRVAVQLRAVRSQLKRTWLVGPVNEPSMQQYSLSLRSHSELPQGMLCAVGVTGVPAMLSVGLSVVPASGVGLTVIGLMTFATLVPASAVLGSSTPASDPPLFAAVCTVVRTLMSALGPTPQMRFSPLVPRHGTSAVSPDEV
jgi:hypothetical protein